MDLSARVLVIKAEDIGSISGALVVKGEKPFSQVFPLTSTCTPWHFLMHACTYTHYY